jgi:taurine dioxygenase
MTLNVSPLQDDLSFGARVGGLTRDMLDDPAVRAELNALFEDRGLIVFEDVEPSGAMHVAISKVFGPLKEHPVPVVPRVDADELPGVIDMRSDPEKPNIVEIAGKQVAHWLPWHFDHCYNNELNRAGVLRALEIPEEGGLTGFADGVELFNLLDPALREQIEGSTIVYTLFLEYSLMRFGKPEGFREVYVPPGHYTTTEQAKTLPRALHPAVWTRDDGQKVLHVSPWMASGIHGREDPEGDALFEAVCQDMIAKIRPYQHKWKPTDMLIWDNWRMLHSVSGHDPAKPRRMQRTTIKGDYGLGRFENDAGGGHKLLEMTV